MRLIFVISFCFSFFSLFAQDAETLYTEGVQLKKEKKSSAAAAKFTEALQLKPGYTEARYELGWCQNDMKNYSGAIENLRTVRNTWSTIPKVYFELGYAFEKTGEIDSAVNAYNTCLRFKSDYSGAHRQLGYIAYNNNDNKTALENFNKYVTEAASEITDYLFWYKKGFTENALKKFDQAKTSLLNSLKYKTEYLNTYLELGFASKNLKQDEDAISFYLQAMTREPKSHIAYNGIGEVYRDNKKDMEKAKEWYGKALAINSNERKANFGMGYCLNTQEKYAEAIPYLQKAIDNEKTYIAAYVELGYSQYKSNNYTAAIANFNKALELNPANENARYYATLLYIAQKNKTRAQKMVDELKDLNSKYVDELQKKVNEMY